VMLWNMILIPQGKVSSLRAMRPSGPAAKGWKQPFYGGMQLIQPHLYATTGLTYEKVIFPKMYITATIPVPKTNVTAIIPIHSVFIFPFLL